MSFVFTIERKRYGGALSRDDVRAFVKGAVDGSIPDYQIAAMCMAICLNEMNEEEARELVVAMLEGGGTYDIARDVPDAVEQHTTGGVGEGVDMTLLPLLATVGLHPTKLTAPAIGISSGIIDKLASIPGMNMTLDRAAFLRVVQKVGLALANHGPDLVPADARLYAIRDVTGTIDSAALIAGSILSKKLATGAPHIHISVKYGRAGLVKTHERALNLAQLMAGIGAAMGRRITVPVVAFDGSLGPAIGNALEVRQAIELVRGAGPPDMRDHIVAMGTQILHLVGRESDPAAGRLMLEQALDSGKVYETFCAWIAAQGGDVRVIEDPEKLPTAPVQIDVTASEDGTVIDLDARLAGELMLELGGGRLRKEDALDYRVGLVLHKRNGDRVARGEPLFTVHAANEEMAQAAGRRLAATYEIGEGQPEPVLREEEVLGFGAATFTQ